MAHCSPTSRHLVIGYDSFRVALFRHFFVPVLGLDLIHPRTEFISSCPTIFHVLVAIGHHYFCVSTARSSEEEKVIKKSRF
jgi:hypothetical protein